MKGLQKELQIKYPAFKVKRSRDGDFTLVQSCEFGFKQITIVFDSQEYHWFRVDGIVRFDAVEQFLAPFIYDMNPAYIKNTMTISCSSWQSDQFEQFQSVELDKIFNTVDFILQNLENVNSIESVALIMDDENFKSPVKSTFIYRIVKSEMRRIAIAKLLEDSNLELVIRRQLKDVESYTYKDDWIYRGLKDLIRSLGF